MTTTIAGREARLDDDDARTPTRATRRRVLPAVAVAALGLGLGLLAGCGSSSSSTSSNTSASTAASTTTSTTSSSDTQDGGNPNSSTTDQSGYLSQIHSQSHFTGLSDSDLTTLGHDVCKDFQGGASLSSVESDALQAIQEINSNDAESGENPGGNLTAHDAGYLIGAAVKNLCPQYLDQVQTS